MLNLLKADLYRLFKTKSYYIVGAILGFFTIMIMYSYGQMVSAGDTNLGFNVLQPELTDLVYNILMNNVIVMIVGIEAAIYICSDFSSGYIKNSASIIKRKPYIVISKFICLLIGIILYLGFVTALTAIFGSLFINGIVLNDVAGFFGYMGMVLFLTMVVVGLVSLASHVFRNNAASITTLVIAILLVQLIYVAINQFLGVDLMDISPIINYQLVSPYNADTWMQMLVSGLGFLGVYLVGAMVFMQRKDII